MRCEVVDIRQFEARPFARLLEAESRVWRDELHWDFTSSARLISNCLEERRLSGNALVVEDQIRGYCFFFLDGEKGLIGDLFVEPGAADLAQVRSLLECTVEKLMATRGLRRIEAQLPHFAYEQLEPSFRAHCFDGYRRRFMVVSLTRRPRPTATPAGAASPGSGVDVLSDFVVQPWERDHDREAAELLYSAYRHHVDTAINDQYASAAGTARLIENIVRHSGCGEYLPRASRAAVHRSTGKLAAVLALTAVGPRCAHIPQVAVATQFQATGLGSALLESSFEELAREGHEEVSLTVTDLNAGAVRLYERLGFETFRPFGAFVWNRP